MNATQMSLLHGRLIFEGFQTAAFEGVTKVALVPKSSASYTANSEMPDDDYESSSENHHPKRRKTMRWKEVWAFKLMQWKHFPEVTAQQWAFPHQRFSPQHMVVNEQG